MLLRILLELELVMGMFLPQYQVTKMMMQKLTPSSDTGSKKLKLFRFNKHQTEQVYGSFIQSRNVIQQLIQYIQTLQFSIDDHDFCKHSLPSFVDYIVKFSEMKKESVNKPVFEYEIIKFCELYYQTLLYLMKNEKILLKKFLYFSKNTILPILEQILTELNSSKISWKFYSWMETLRICKANDDNRCETLLDFLLSFLASQGIMISDARMYKYNTVNDLIALCVNIFVRFHLFCRKDPTAFYEMFTSQKYPISELFIDFLFLNGNFTGYIYRARTELRKFFNENKLDLEMKFVDQKVISAVFDRINRDASIFSIPTIR